MTDETEILVSHYVASHGDSANARIGDDIAWAMGRQEWEEVQRLQRARQRLQALQQHAQEIKHAADLAERQARFVPGLTVRSLDEGRARPLRLSAA